MKAIHTSLFAGLLASLLILGCSNIAEQETNDNPVQNNPSQSEGDNELEGKSFMSSSSSYSLTFSGDSVTYQADAESSSSLRSADASTWKNLLKYQYSGIRRPPPRRWNSS